MKSMSRGFRCVCPLACALLFCLHGCDVEPGVPQQDRYARRALATDQEWIRESEIPRGPPKPMMVMWEVSAYPPGATPTPEQQRAAEDLIERSHQAVRAHGWQDHEKALADGFHLMLYDVRHFQNDAFLLDDRVLDPDRPEFLMYQRMPEGMALTGMMFLARSPDERGPQVGGPLTVWHFHHWKRIHCYRDGAILVGQAQRGQGCVEGVGSARSPEMLHVWLIDRPGGSFATSMRVDETSLPGLLAKRKQEQGY